MTTTPTERVRQALEVNGCDPRGPEEKFTARCPAHDDRHPSLVVTAGADGRALVYCHAGCRITEVLTALNLQWSDLFVEVTPGRGSGPGHLPAPRNPDPRPSPGVTPEAELVQLLAEHKAGRLEPFEVLLGPMPDTASPAMRQVAAHVALCLGLRAAVDDLRPLPYSTAFALQHSNGELRDKRHASRVIRRLVDAGVICHAGELPRRPGFADGTRLVQSPLGDAAVPLVAAVARAADRCNALADEQVGEERVAVEPAHEVVEQLAVEVAESALGVPPGAAVRMTASRHRAGSPAVEHDELNPTSAVGMIDADAGHWRPGPTGRNQDGELMPF